LIRTYKPGDKIYIFGFSRGSFVGRILAGMIEKIGLLDEGLEDMVKTAWKIYKEWEIMGQPNNLENPAKCGYSIKLFKQTFCRYDVSIEFMGLFDSINSCGIFFDKLFPFTSNSSNVKHIRHAVSIHERRSKFKQNLFIPHSYLPHFLASKSSCSSLNSRSSGQINDENYTLSNTDNDSDRRFHNIPVQYAKKCSSDLLEVWFPGDHSDIGGGWPCDDNGSRISNLPMQWILSSAFRFGVRFKKNALQEFNIKFTPLLACLSFQHDTLSLKGYNYSYNVNPYCSSINNQEINYEEENVDNPGSYYVNPISDTNSMELPKLKSPLFPIFPKHSSESEIFDEINQPNKNEALRGHGNSSIFASFMWWILEILPIGYMVENQNGKWRPLYWPNLGESRNIPSEAKIHWSILWRMKFIKDIDYKNLPSVYETLQKLVDQEQNSDIITNPDKQEIILGLKDVVDLENEIIKPDIDRIILKLKNSNKVIKLDIDWKNPPNELKDVINMV
jgi:hypothetical protein